jgi:hypothetical protein
MHAEPCHAKVRVAAGCPVAPSHPPQQLAPLWGMIPSFCAAAIMPRCRGSARRTQHRRHKVRRFPKRLFPRLPERIWSNMSLGQTRAAVTANAPPSISFPNADARRLLELTRRPLVVGIVHLESAHLETAETPFSPITNASILTRVHTLLNWSRLRTVLSQTTRKLVR